MSCVTRRRFAGPPCEDPRDSVRLGNIGNLDFLSALTCPTPSHYSIIYYRSSLWESKHRSHVTLCDHSSEGGDYSSSSSPCFFVFFFYSLSSSTSSFAFSLLPLHSPPLSFSITFHAIHETPARRIHAGRDFLARRTRRRDATRSFFLRIARAGNKLRR